VSETIYILRTNFLTLFGSNYSYDQPAKEGINLIIYK